MGREERKIWNEHISSPIYHWIKHIDEERSNNGVLCFRRGIAVSETSTEAASFGDMETVPGIHNQFAMFLDLSGFERSGRSFKDHRTGKLQFEKFYKPGAELSDGKGKTELMVELAVLKKSDFEAEYISCVEGTGLMNYENVVLKQ